MTSDQSSEPTSHNEVEELMVKAEEKILSEQEQQELEQIFQENINGFNEAMTNTLKEIMEGGTHGEGKTS